MVAPAAFSNASPGTPRHRPPSETLAEAFIDLQAARIRADYDPKPAFSRREAVVSVDLARQGVALLRDLPDDAKRLLSVLLISKQR